MSRLQEKHDLFTNLGMLFGPLVRLAGRPDEYDEQEKAEAWARYFAEYRDAIYAFTAFTEGQPGHRYLIQSQQFRLALSQLESFVAKASGDLSQIVKDHLSRAQDAIAAVPIPATSVILEAGSPFTTYCRLREFCEADASKSIVWFDPYMAASIFHRFVANVRNGVPVTLVISEPNAHAGNLNRARWNEFLDVSRQSAFPG